MKDAIGCKTCGLVQQWEEPPSGHVLRCGRCNALLQRTVVHSRARTGACALAALMFYAPANLYPVLIMDYMGRHSENTVWGGVVRLYQDGMWFVATVVFFASIVVPLLKLTGLLLLVINLGPRWQKERTWLYQTICWLGPWAMLDVFLVAVAVALVRFGDFATVIPGPGIFAFAAVVVLTLVASASFDSRLIWKDAVL